MPVVSTYRMRKGTASEWSTAQSSSSYTASVTAISYAGTTITYTASNSFTSGQYVTINGATSQQYNGTFQIATASSTQFTVTRTITAGTTSTATATIPILLEGEMGMEIDSSLVKIGDGKRIWDYLPYFANQKNLGVREFASGTYFFSAHGGAPTTTAVSHTLNTAYLTPFEVPSTTNISKMGIWRTATGTGVSLGFGIYNHNYTTNLPGTLRYNAGPLTTTVSAARFDASLSENGNSYITLLPGIYWVCTAPSDAAFTIQMLFARGGLMVNSTALTSTSYSPGSYTAPITMTAGVLPNVCPAPTGTHSYGSDRVAFLVA